MNIDDTDTYTCSTDKSQSFFIHIKSKKISMLMIHDIVHTDLVNSKLGFYCEINQILSLVHRHFQFLFRYTSSAYTGSSNLKNYNY